MNNTTTQILVFIFKIILGISFIYASFSKIEDPASFATIVYGYDIFPSNSINLIAIVIPFIELTAGLSILMGLYPRSAVFIINGLLLSFIVLISFNLIRGHQFDCGCFSVAGENQSLANIMSLVRDIFMLAAGIFVWKNIEKKPKQSLLD